MEPSKLVLVVEVEVAAAFPARRGQRDQRGQQARQGRKDRRELLGQ
jgi:hypothetical protein